MEKTIVHGCGGAGVSIVAKYVESLTKDSMLNVETRYLDTSRADIDRFKDLNIENIHIITSKKLDTVIDGSGGRRDTNSTEIQDNINKYVDAFKYGHGEVHIVVSSASGGSGSVASTLLIAALKKLNVTVIFICITDNSSLKYTEHSVNTLKYLELVGNKYSYKIPTIMIANEERTEVTDKRVAIQIEALAILNSGHIKSFDTMDTKLFLTNGYNDKDTGGIYTLSILSGDMSRLGDEYISTLRVLDNGLNVKLPDGIGQYKIGIIDRVVEDRLLEAQLSLPIYYAVTSNINIEKIGKLKEDLVRQYSMVVKRKVFLDEEDSIDGLII